MKEKSVAFVVLTCDNYSDLWPMTIHFIEKNWPDCPFDKYFVTNFKSISESSFECIKIGKDESWSDNLLKVLSFLKEKYEYVIITLEDVPIVEKVDQGKFNKILNIFFEIDANFLCFINRPKATRKFNEFFGVIDKGSIYRPTCEYSLWKISVLEDLLAKGENAWEFEKFGSVRSDKYDKFFVVYKSVFKECHTVIKGKWRRGAINELRRIGYKPDIGNRTLFSRKDELLINIYAVIFNIFNRTILFPWQIRRKIVFKIRGYKY